MTAGTCTSNYTRTVLTTTTAGRTKASGAKRPHTSTEPAQHLIITILLDTPR